MAELKDAEGVQKQVYSLASGWRLVELRALLEEHPDVNVDGYQGWNGRTALFWVCGRRFSSECAQLLIDRKADVDAKDNHGSSPLHEAAERGPLSSVELLVRNGADVNCKRDNGQTPLLYSAVTGRLTVAHYLVEQKADIHYRILHGRSENVDALHCAMCERATNCSPGTAFALLSCNTDVKNVSVGRFVSIGIRDTHIEEYKHVHTFIDEYHRFLTRILSEHVPVDPRFGLGQMGIYQEPLERALEYLGLSMSKDQVVNTSIDGEAVRRALIPGHLLNANYWFDKYTSRE
jgi:hypothetical protein